jgi:septum formation protein
MTSRTLPLPTSARQPRLILGSTSSYRRALLQRLRLPFEVVAPGVDETARPAERPIDLALRLALEKAQDVALRHPDAVVIGADQVADLDGVAVGKPGNFERARAQLQGLSGRTVVFHSAVAVVCQAIDFAQVVNAPVTVRFRRLTDPQIDRYLRLEQPYDCAGSAKCETLGITLLEAIDSDDPTALIGLPLIRTSALLRACGLDALAVPA